MGAGCSGRFAVVAAAVCLAEPQAARVLGTWPGTFTELYSHCIERRADADQPGDGAENLSERVRDTMAGWPAVGKRERHRPYRRGDPVGISGRPVCAPRLV